MNTTKPSARAILTIVLCAACHNDMVDGVEPTTMSTGAVVPESGFTPDYATNPDFFTLMEEPYVGTSPHGTVTIWYSEDLRVLIESGDSFTAPVGATSIKEVDNGRLALAVMTKQAPGYDPDHGDWYYEFLEIDGTVLQAGLSQGCIDCHQAFEATDYLGGTQIP